MKMNPVVHFEMPAKDKKRVSNFYSKVFGWHMQVMGEEFGGYLVATTTESTDKGPKKPGAINGGFFDYKDDELNKIPHFVVSVDDLKESIKQVEAEGGKVIGEQMDIPGVGLYVSFRDTEDNIVGMLQPSTM